MKKLMPFLIGLIILSAVNSSIVDAVELSTFHYPPLLSKTMIGNLGNGLFVDVAKDVFKVAEVPWEIKFLPVKRSVLQFKDGKHLFTLGAPSIFKAFGLTKDNTSLLSLGFYHGYFYYLKSRYPVKISYEKLSELSQYKIGIISGSHLVKVFKNAGLNVEEAKNPETNLKKLLKNRIDLWAVVDLTSKHVIRQHFPDKADEIVAIDKPLTTGEISIGFSKSNQSAQKIGIKLAASLQKMKQDGSYLKILKGYWGEDPPKNVLPLDMR
jgi:polar amino acid transport system substrate-binding protein